MRALDFGGSDKTTSVKNGGDLTKNDVAKRLGLVHGEQQGHHTWHVDLLELLSVADGG